MFPSDFANIQLDSDLDSSRFARLEKVETIFGFLTLLVTGLVLFYNWDTLTPCYQRQAIAIFVVLLYWQFKDDSLSSYFLEALQILIIFILIQNLNMRDVGSSPECLAIDTPLKKVIYILYFCMFGYYISVGVIFGAILFAIAANECRRNYVIAHHVSIRGNEFESLERVKFSKENIEQQQNSQVMCSICLNDFEDQEEIIKLPVCSHLFHKECLKKWLENRLDCPYCRSDIKTNLRTLRGESNVESNSVSNNGNNINISAVSAERSQNEGSGGVEDRQGRSLNSSQVYVEMARI